MEATDRLTICAEAVGRRVDIAIVVEVEEVRVEVIGRTGPPAAAGADTDEAAIVVFHITRSRIPNRTGAAKLVAEVHSFICGVPGMGEFTAGLCGFRPDAT